MTIQHIHIIVTGRLVLFTVNLRGSVVRDNIDNNHNYILLIVIVSRTRVWSICLRSSELLTIWAFFFCTAKLHKKLKCHEKRSQQQCIIFLSLHHLNKQKLVSYIPIVIDYIVMLIQLYGDIFNRLHMIIFIAIFSF